MVFTIEGEPRGKQRPRYTVRGGYVHEYTPSETVAYEKEVKAAFYEAGGTMIDGPVKIEVWAFCKIPASKSRTAAESMQGAPSTKKPDADNVLKIVMDGLNGEAYADDKQVVEAIVHKRYWPDGRVVVDIEGA